ncbi:putative oxidoreductase [Rosa chinensis]|uniref:glyoxylate reductase (NADP(+)) n=1 Tax=Rosa chinensis TaxID=74649 RepID=A0A2P6SGD7_ROSCH|nr:putative oxidoreductase [Rosa chinensis]
MADDNQSELPTATVLILRQSGFIGLMEPKLSQKFNLLKAWDSPLPQDQFLTTHARSVQALISSANGPPITTQILHLLPSLKLIATTSAGIDHVDLAECRRRGVAVSNAGKAFAEDAADSAVGLFIDVMRKISASNQYVRDGLWSTRGDYPLGSKIGGKKVGIVGLGNIGFEVAKRLEAFGCSVSYNSRSERPYLSYQFYSNVCELAADSDALIICCALTEQTHHMINKEVLSALGREGWLLM